MIMDTHETPLPRSVFVAGATGYLGRYICNEFQRRGWHVTALVRDPERGRGLDADRLVAAQATRPETLRGVMDGASLAISALGITRQVDGLDYMDVDYQANVNLLDEAESAGVSRFGYVHVLNADEMPDVPLVAAKSAFVRRLETSPVPGTVISPSGYFSDMGDFLDMARSGRVWLFGHGEHRINPIHGADLAAVAADALMRGQESVEVGGPDVFTHTELAELAFATLGRPSRIARLPDRLRRAALALLPRLTPRRVHGPASFFLTAMGIDMVGDAHGTRHLADDFAGRVRPSERAPVNAG